MAKISRRDLLKLGALLPVGVPLSRLLTGLRSQDRSPNIIILVFDALSAANMSVYGYPRRTTPNIEKFAERATVFHSHYSAGSSTPPGTSSLLTGMYPWTHRATFSRYPIRRDLVDQNLFQAIGREYTRIGFTQNLMAEVYLDQFHAAIDRHLSPASFGPENYLVSDKFSRDPGARYRAFEFFAFAQPPASLVFGTANLMAAKHLDAAQDSAIVPYGSKFLFTLTDVFEGVASLIKEVEEPFLAYVHLWPPHAPYTPAREFAGMFRDGWAPPYKPIHPLSGTRTGKETLLELRRNYDCYVAQLDWEFGRFIETIEHTPAFKSSYFVLTSDHGELFERGEHGHESPLLYDAAIRSPLIVASPGQDTRRDYRSLTNSVDIVPTLISLAGKAVPTWCEGRVLPGFGGHEDPNRLSYSFDAKGSSAFGRLYPATMVLRRGDFKLIYYVGYKGYKGYRNDPRFETGEFELFNLAEDPEEKRSIFAEEPEIAGALRDMLLTKYQEVAGGPAD